MSKGAGFEGNRGIKGAGGGERHKVKGAGEAEPHGRHRPVLCITVFIYERTRHGGFLLLYKEKHNSLQWHLLKNVLFLVEGSANLS